ncbi:Hypoxanthine-guanine phosphoribosyltransferase [hydrothermal vent metagenome]|uniref:hypoxanthine phosphoribosyltransferase n=1 Tax=hydrothermal vent metagenome TaxID=652676 RepID=A0A3B1CYF2_9ZZZZ
MPDFDTKQALNTLISQSEIANRVDALAASIAKDTSGSPTILVALLKGSVVFLSDLMRRLHAHGVSPVIDFLMVSSYKDTQESSGTIEIISDIKSSVEGKTVVLIDDIIDTGRTMLEVKKRLEAKHADKVLTVALLDKPSRRKVDILPDYYGFTIDDVFVVGYGLDFAGEYRCLPYIATIEN